MRKKISLNRLPVVVVQVVDSSSSVTVVLAACSFLEVPVDSEVVQRIACLVASERYPVVVAEI